MFRTDLFVGPSETEMLMLMRQILQTRIPLYYYKQGEKKANKSVIASFLSHMVMIMFNETFLATAFLLANPTGSESFNFA